MALSKRAAAALSRNRRGQEERRHDHEPHANWAKGNREYIDKTMAAWRRDRCKAGPRQRRAE